MQQFNKKEWQFPFSYVVMAIFLLFVALPIFGQGIKITASVDRNPVSMNEGFVYQVKVTGNTNSLPEVQLPNFSTFRIIQGPNQSTNFQILNGAISNSKTYTL